MKTTRPDRRRARRGFTTVEVGVVSSLMVLLSVILGATWSAFGRPLIDADTRCRLVLEARMAATALAHDLDGSVAMAGGRAGGRFVGRMVTGNGALRLCFDGGSSPDGLVPPPTGPSPASW